MRILVPYHASEQGTRLIRCAGDLSNRLSAKLRVILPYSSIGASVALILEESIRIQRLVHQLGFSCDVTVADIEIMTNEPDSILVSNDFPKRTDLTILSPFWEDSLKEGKRHRVLVPFGGRDAGRFAIAIVMPIIAMLGFDVVFYHTTWREGIASVKPGDHMSAEARVTQSMVEQIARSANVPFTTIIETAEDVTEGIILAALNCQASLIVTAHGLNVVAGSYATQLRIGPVPILTIGRRTEVLS